MAETTAQDGNNENVSTKLYLKKFRKASDDIKKVKCNLESIKTKMEKHIMCCKISRGIGTGASTVGFALSFLTPICPPVGLIGIGLSAAGGITNIGTAIGDASVTNSKMNEISSTVGQFKNSFNDVLVLSEHFAKTVFYNQTTLRGNFDLMKDLMKSKSSHLNSIDLSKLTAIEWKEMIKIAMNRTPALIVFACAAHASPTVFNVVIGPLTFITNCHLIQCIAKIVENLATSIIGKSINVAEGVATSVAETVGSTSSRVAARAAVGVLGGVFVVVDVTHTIIQNHCQEHVTIEQLDSVLPPINEVNKLMKEILEELESFLAPGA